MEWVQTTGRTVDEAVDAALDELGVHAEDVEVEVLEEPKAGFLGRFGGSEARVRVRLKPELRTPEAMAKIQEQLNSHEHVGEASINPRTGSVLFTHAKHRRGE